MKTCIYCGAAFIGNSWSCPECHKAPKQIEGFHSFAPELAESNDGFEVDYFERLSQLEPGSFWFRARNHLIIWSLQRYFPVIRSFFEIGCGTGFVLSGIEKVWPALKLFGSEIYSAGLHFAAQRIPTTTLFQMDARNIPFEKEFDVIGAFDVLEHIENDAGVLQQMHKAVRPGGGIILTVPQHNFLWSGFDEQACHVRRYSAKELKAKVEKAGFKICRMTSFVTLLLPLMMLSRLCMKYNNNNGDPLEELRIGRAKNALLESILALERGLICTGMNMPFGGSLLIVAKKQQ